MLNSSLKPQQLRDRIVQSRIHRERNQFIASIRKEDILRLIESLQDGCGAEFFSPPVRGSYNVCFFVELKNGKGAVDKFVVRVPLAPCLGYGAKEKLESEIATMRLLAEKTSIPIPKVHAYSFSDDSGPLSSYMILQYVEGRRLSYAQLRTLTEQQQNCLYTSLADIHVQLRRLEFPSIGRLEHSPDGFHVRKPVTTIDINMQQLEGLNPYKIRDKYYDHSASFLTSTAKYVEMLLQIASNAFTEGRSSVFDEDEGADALYHLHLFRLFAEKWMDRDDHGPFVLAHGDFEPFNLIVDDDMNVISVLDWEWSRVVPRQFFGPPLWLGIPDTTKLAYEFVYEDYLKKFDKLLAKFRAREMETYGDDVLYQEWSKGKEDSGFLVANALENWTDMDWFANRYVNRKWFRGIDLDERVQAFMEEDPARKALIARKAAEGLAYEAEVERLKKGDDTTTEQGNNERKHDPGRSSFYRLWRDLPLQVADLHTLAFLVAVVFITGVSYSLRKNPARR
ncbi:hypothetical protein VTK73DRAFT_6360 [Phialemonium thermophilum]|uniref:Aminoglycoside phosphotransferase domain-containing protein n=1 Tax=Phialemonium thermophilum TaxID=223376 RepID=A0ABR3WK18_9PEZI